MIVRCPTHTHDQNTEKESQSLLSERSLILPICCAETPAAASAAVALIEPSVQGILDQLHTVVMASTGGAQQVARELAVLSELAVYAKDGEQALTLVDILVHFLKTDRRLRHTTRHSILVIITKLIPLAPEPLKEKYLAFFSSQFGLRRKGPNARDALCQLFRAFAEAIGDAHLKQSAGILEDLNAMESGSLDGYDFTRRSKAASMASDGDFDAGYPDEALLPIVWHMQHDLFEDELSLRVMASRVKGAL
jgi:hypothetical protein